MTRRTGGTPEGNVRTVDVRTGRIIDLFLDGACLQVVAPDRTSRRGVSVTEFPLDEVLLAGPVAGRLAGRRGGWTLTRSVTLDDRQWGASAPAWSWLLVPDDGNRSRRAGETFLAELRRALPSQRWASRIRLTAAARQSPPRAAAELLDLACRRDEALAAVRVEVAAERARRAAGMAAEAERILLESLRRRTTSAVTMAT